MNYPPCAKPFVMLVDDSEIDALVTRRVIEKADFASKFIVMRSGNSALEYLQGCISGSEAWPDVIFLDISMPITDGFNFMEAFEQMRPHIRPGIKIHVLSSSDCRSDMERMMGSGNVQTFLTKPLKTDMLHKLAESA